MTMNNHEVSPYSVVARYTPQRVPRFKDNPLIEALPPTLSDDQLYEALSQCPEFEPDQRSWSTEERILLLQDLSGFVVPLARHVELARTLDGMLRAGYVGRAPRTQENARRLQDVYEKKSRGDAGAERMHQSPSQSSALLMGISGMGKTTMVRHLLSLCPQVIYHPEYNIYQVTHLHVEMPSDGSSVKGLAEGILSELDKIVPGANHFQNLALSGRPGADSLIKRVARALHMHHVGLLVADETQNLANAHKGKQTVMTELVSMCNTIGIPILFIGTNKCQKVSSLDFRQARRTSGGGLSHWDRLMPALEPGAVDEWDDFLQVLWGFQWVRNPVPLDAQLRAQMHHYTQGVIDVAIKLFASAQARAMLDGSERITPQLLADIYKEEMSLIHPMLEALRNNDHSRLALYDDIAHVGLEQMLNSIQNRLKAKRSSAHSLLPKDAMFASSIATALVASGFGESESLGAAEEVAQDDRVRNLAEGTAKAIKKLSVPRPVSAKKKANATAGLESGDAELASELADRPEDYRRAILSAREHSTTIHEQLVLLRMARPLEELLDLF